MDAILTPFESLIGWMISEIYEFVPSVGVAIVLVTIAVMLLIFPLTHKQTKSTLAMQALQPKMKELQVKYKDDRQKLSEETMALYREAGVNPLGSCLPLIVQMPFLFSIFRVVRHVEKYASTDSKLFRDLCNPVKTHELCRGSVSQLRSAGFSVEEAERLAQKLPVGKEFFGLQLSKSFPAVTDMGFKVIAAYVGMTLALVLTSYISMSRQQKINPNTPAQFKYLKYIFPIGIAMSGIFLPAGSNLYILTSSTWRACQQEFLYRKIILPHREKHDANDKKQIEAIGKPGSDPNYQAGLARQKRKKK